MKLRLLAIGMCLISNAAQAKPLPSEEIKTLAEQERLTARDDDDFDFSGQVEFLGCSGSVVSFGQDASAKAVVMTNGHCIGMLDRDPREVIIDQPREDAVNLYIDRKNSFWTETTRIIYGLMYPYDLALLELDETYGELESRGVRARKIAAQGVPVGTPLILASGFWNEVLRCDVVAIIYEIHEDIWINKDSYKYRCNARHGTSGSPLINIQTGEVVGANYTGNDNGGRCTYNNPCEVDEEGNVTVERGANYGDPIHEIMKCLNERREIDLTVDGCPLPR
jgi:V8-like Glu-specific endopeptidase